MLSKVQMIYLLRRNPLRTISFPPLSMRSPEIHTSLVVSILLLLSASAHALAGDVSPEGFDGSERDALYALKADFNHYFLNKNWKGLQCYLNHPPAWYGIQCRDGRVTGISLEGIGLTGGVKAHALVNLTQLTFLSFKNNWVSGNVMDFSSNKKLTHVDLSDNMFDGSIPRSLLDLDSLESLQLQGNKLTGPIPEFSQVSLKEFNVSKNNLSGEIPPTPVLQSFNFSSYFGNPEICGRPSPDTCNVSNDDSASSAKDSFWSAAYLVIIFVILDVIALIIVVLLFMLWYKKSKKIKQEKKKSKDFVEVENKKKNEKKIEDGEKNVVNAGEERGKLTFIDGDGGFELDDLLKASAEGLGKGNFGKGYKAMLESGPTVVVKRLRDLRPLSTDEFMKHIRLLAGLKHPNLMPLLAYYHSRDENLLIYKFAQKGNLFNRIHEGRGNKNNRIPFKWSSRLAVAQTVARAMEYLHLNCKSPLTIIPHGNLKSSNVLIDENATVLVSDYGMASLIALPVAAERMIAYKSPEYQYGRKVSKKSDVWSYGSLLLELLTGRISIFSAPQGSNGVDLCSWVHRAVREEWTAEIFDSEICVRRSASEGMLKLLQIAIRCSDKSPEKRPEMEEVVREVQGIKIHVSEDDDDDSVDCSSTDDSSSSYVQG